MKVSAILLAAGLSRRMGQDKLLLIYKEKSLLQHSIDLMVKLPVFERILVTSDARVEHLVLTPGIRLVVNPLPENGQSGSIHTGIKAATGSHYLFLAADQPRITSDDLKPLLETARANQDSIIVTTIDSKPNSPTLFPKRFRNDLLNLTGDTGGRIVRDANRESCCSFEPVNPINFRDIDSAEDFYDIISC